MFAKPFNLILVYIVTTFNIVILSSPLIVFLIPFANHRGSGIEIPDNVLAKFNMALFLIIFLVSFFMLIYIFLDFLFGFAMRSSIKGCQRFEKNKDYDFLSKIFDEVKDKFGQHNVKLYIKNSQEINAFAVSSFWGKSIVLTDGIINHYLNNSQNPKEFLYSLRSIMGHEMSHLINKDFLPTYLIIANQKATNFVSFLLDIIFGFATRIALVVPLGSRFLARTMTDTYAILNFIFGFFNRFVVFNVYEFLRKFSSRSIEYRCDRQSGEAFGGKNMAFALSFLGDSGYITIFSTHPNTKKRIKKVENIDIKDGIIRPKFVDSLSNYFAFMMLIFISLFFAKKADIDILIREYLNNHEVINSKLRILWGLIKGFI